MKWENDSEMTSSTIAFRMSFDKMSLLFNEVFVVCCIHVHINHSPFFLLSKSSTIMRPKVPPPLPPKVKIVTGYFFTTINLLFQKLDFCDFFINNFINQRSAFPSSPSPFARPSSHSSQNSMTANHTARTTAEAPSNAVQSQRRPAPQSPPPTSPRGPRPRSCRPTAVAA